MKVYFDKKVVVGFFLALGGLTLLGFYSYRNSQNSLITNNMVSHSNDILYRIENLHATHLEIETELIRYVITGDTSFQRFFAAKINEAREHFISLRELVKDSAQQIRIDSIRASGSKKVEFIGRVIAARSYSQDSARQLIPSSYNRNLLLKINGIVEKMQEEEKKLLNQRIAANRLEVGKFYTTFSTLLITTTIIVIVLFIAINSTLRARLQTEQALQTAAGEINDLYHNAPCGYHSLDRDGVIVEMNDTWLEWVGYKREDVIGKMRLPDLLTSKSREVFDANFPIFKSQGFINNLEFEVVRKDASKIFIILNGTSINDENGHFIKSRSTVFNITDRRLAEEKVIEMNRELEAFTYSVSHDLRAPLRSIDGYSKILQEDHAGTMDREANRILQIVRNNARRMGQLIDDLLEFSRIGRKELDKINVSMTTLVGNIKQDLIASEKEHTIDFRINPLADVAVDISMIRQVWINLISNAIKYSRKRDVSKIEIGCDRDQDKVIYYVKDNGVGFDMKYADKLFGVFQRLHKIEEFEGTGVGLALVHRIVSRHGGKIWAEAAVNHGATFFFFIPIQNSD